MILQNSTLFAGNSEAGGIVLAPGRAMTAHTGYLIPVSILSIAFPLMILAMHVKELAVNRYMLFAWLCAAVIFCSVKTVREHWMRTSAGDMPLP